MDIHEVVAEVDSVVAREIRHQRKQLGWSQEVVARKMSEHGISWHQTMVGKIELGERTLHLHEAIAMAAVLGLGSLNGLFGDRDPEYKRVIAQATLDCESADRAKFMAEARRVLRSVKTSA